MIRNIWVWFSPVTGCGSLFLHLGHMLFLAFCQQVLEFADFERLRGVVSLQVLQLLLGYQQLVGRLKRQTDRGAIIRASYANLMQCN